METKNKKINKDNEKMKHLFDAVKFMREQRDRISKAVAHLSPEQILKHFDEIKKSSDIRPGA